MICQLLFDEINNKKLEFKVHSVFNNAVNFLYDNNKLCTILSASKPMQPYAIKVDNLPIFLKEERIVFNNNTFISNNWELNIDHLVKYNPKKEYIRTNSIGKIESCLIILKESIIKANKNDGIMPLLFCTTGMLDEKNLYIKDDFYMFIESIKSNNFIMIKEYSKRICGFGNGLAPAMDDFICGYMLGKYYLNFLSENNFENENNEIVNNLRGRTNSISYHMLKLASKGLCNQYQKELFDSIFEGNKEIHSKITKAIDFGSSSGSDILCGFYVTVKNNLKNTATN